MPASIVAAVAASAVADAVGGGILGAIAGGVVAGGISAAFADRPRAKPGASQDSRNGLITLRQPISPWQVIYGQARVGGVLTYAETTIGQQGEENQYLHLVITLAGHQVEEIGDIYFNDELVPLDANGMASSGHYAGWATVLKDTGSLVVQPFPNLVAASAGLWTDAHRQTGRAKIYVRLSWNPDVYTSGIPNITAVLKGRKVYDPRSTLTAWANNADLCIADYLCDASIGLGASYASEIDSAQLIAAANSDDEAVSLAAGGTEARYTVDGAFTVDLTPREILGRLLSATAGRANFIGGLWRLLPAIYRTPIGPTLGPGDLRAPVHFQPRLARRDLANGVKGTFSSAATSWQPTDFPPVASSTYLAEDDNERIWRELDLAYTKSPSRCQRIAKIELLRTRNQMVIEWPGKFSCYQYQPGDVAPITWSKYGLSSSPFEVVGATLVFEPVQDGAVRLGCDLVLRQTASAVFDWSTSEESTMASAPSSNLPNAFTVGVPGIPSVVESLFQTTGSAGVKSRATVSWGASPDAFVQTGGQYEIEYTPAGGTLQRAFIPATDTRLVLDDLPAGNTTFRVRAISTIGARSAWSATTTVYLFGLTAAPSDVQNFAVQSYAGQAKFTWTKPSASSDLDVLIGGRTYVRWSPLTAGATWDHGSLVNPDGYPGDTSIGFGPLMTGTYMAKHADSSGNPSANEASFVVTEALITSLSTLATVTESPAFSGTKTNVAAVDGGIQLDGTTLIDAMLSNIDDWGAIDSLGGVQVTGNYAFSAKLDLGSVKNARLFSTIGSIAYDTDDLVDSRTNNVDDWGLVDGVVVEDAEVQLMVRATSDDPNGTPSWGPWHALGMVADYSARGFDFRLDFATGNPVHNRSVTTLSVAAKQ